MPIQNYGGFKRMTTLCKTFVPQYIFDDLEPIKDDDQAVKDYGVQLAIKMCNYLKKSGGVKGFHFYTLNLEKSVRLILEGLKFVAPLEVIKPLPWHPVMRQLAILFVYFFSSLWARTVKKKMFVRFTGETELERTFFVLKHGTTFQMVDGVILDLQVRAITICIQLIFFQAYGELDGLHGISWKHTPEDCFKMWGSPQSEAELRELFIMYLENKIPALPWCESPITKESEIIRDKLIELNGRNGILTINSQPSIDGVRSNDPVFGWGPKNGYVYQKVILVDKLFWSTNFRSGVYGIFR